MAKTSSRNRQTSKISRFFSKIASSKLLTSLFVMVIFGALGGAYLLFSKAATSTGRFTVNAPAVAFAEAGATDKYWIITTDGGVFGMGGAPFYGSHGSSALSQPITAAAARPQHDGYWLLGGDGGVFGYGAAKSYNHPALSTTLKAYRAIVSTPSGLGYWIIGAGGQITAWGDAQTLSGKAAAGHSSIDTDIGKYNTAFGGLPGLPASGITSAARSVSGQGLILISSTGAVYAYGDMPNRGAPNTSGKAAVAVTVDKNNGYIIVANNGAVFGYGTTYQGGANNLPLNGLIVAADFTADSGGYWLLGQDGGIFGYGNALFEGNVLAPTTHVCPDGKTYLSTLSCPAQPAPTPPPPVTPTPVSAGGSTPTAGDGSPVIPKDPCTHILAQLLPYPSNYRDAVCAAQKSLISVKANNISVDGVVGPNTHDACAAHDVQCGSIKWMTLDEIVKAQQAADAEKLILQNKAHAAAVERANANDSGNRSSSKPTKPKCSFAAKVLLLCPDDLFALIGEQPRHTTAVVPKPWSSTTPTATPTTTVPPKPKGTEY